MNGHDRETIGEPARERLSPVIPDLRAVRDDSHVCILLGRIVPGAIPPLLPALAGVLIVGTLLAAGQGRLSGITLLAPVAALLLSGLSSGHPHNGRFDWLVPPVLRVTEYGYLAVLGLASGVPGPVVFVLLMAVINHHRDGFTRPAVGVARAGWVHGAALGWDGRMLVIAAGGAFHAFTLAYGILAGYLAVLLVHEAVRTWSATPVTDVRTDAAAGGGATDQADPRIARPGHANGGQPATGTNGEA